MDSANKQDAIVTEVTQGTIPASPAFKLLRSSNISGTPSRQSVRSPERTANRALTHMVTGLSSFRKTINMPWVRDAATDLLLQSMACNTFSTNTLTQGSALQPLTLEEKYEGGATDPYRRLAGAVVDTATFNLQIGQPGSMQFTLIGMAETMDTTALASSTYASPSPGNDPISPIDILVTSLFGLSSAKVQSLNMTFANNMRELYKFGSDSPYGVGLGNFTLNGSLSIYFGQASDYSTFMTRQIGQALDITIGSVANFKDELIVNNAHVYNPDISDPGQTGDNTVALTFEAAYAAGDASPFKWLRNVA